MDTTVIVLPRFWLIISNTKFYYFSWFHIPRILYSPLMPVFSVLLNYIYLEMQHQSFNSVYREFRKPNGSKPITRPTMMPSQFKISNHVFQAPAFIHSTPVKLSIASL